MLSVSGCLSVSLILKQSNIEAPTVESNDESSNLSAITAGRTAAFPYSYEYSCSVYVM